MLLLQQVEPWQECPTRIQRHDCPAYGTICDKCGWLNQFVSICCSKSKSTRPQKPTPPSGDTRETESVTFDSLCTATSLSNKPGKGVISLDHHLYCHLTDHWIRQPSKPTSWLTPVQLSTMADTGCLGLCGGDLIPVTMQMHTVNNKGIKILGAVILRFSGKSLSYKTFKSWQIL